MRVFIEYSDVNIRALIEAHPDILEEERDEQNILCFKEDPSPLSCEYLLTLDIATYFDKLNGNQDLYSKCKAAILGSNAGSCFKLLIEASETMFTNQTDKVDGVFTSLVVLLQTAPDVQADLVKLLVEKLVASDNNSILRTRLFSLLFNNLDVESPSRFEVYDALVQYCGQNGKIDCLKSQIPQLDTWFKEWNSTIEQKRQLYKHFNVAGSLCGEEEIAHTFMTKYFATFNGESADVINNAKQATIDCLATSLKVPTYYEMDDLLEYDIVKSLSGTAESELLNIFVSGDYNDYLQFAAKNPKTITNLALDEEENMRKMRLLSLVSLCSGKREVEFSAIASALQLDVSEIESWIIDAIGAKLIEAKVDQINHKLLVRRSIYRTFTTSQWQQLHDRLSSWERNVASILEIKIQSAAN